MVQLVIRLTRRPERRLTDSMYVRMYVRTYVCSWVLLQLNPFFSINTTTQLYGLPNNQCIRQHSQPCSVVQTVFPTLLYPLCSFIHYQTQSGVYLTVSILLLTTFKHQMAWLGVRSQRILLCKNTLKYCLATILLVSSESDGTIVISMYIRNLSIFSVTIATTQSQYLLTSQ